MGEIISALIPVLLHRIITFFTTVIWMQSAAMLHIPYDATLCTVIGNLLVIPVAIWLYRKDGSVLPVSDNSWTYTGKILFGVFCLVSGGILNYLWSSALSMMRIQEIFSDQVQTELLSANVAVQILGLGFIVPLSEELIFRGLSYRRMKRIFSVKTAIILSALLFAVYHENPIQIIFAFPLALILAAVFEHGKLFIFPVLFHIGANLFAVFMNLFI